MKRSKRTFIDAMIAEMLANKKKRYSATTLLTVQRHIKDLQRSDFEYYFDAEKGMEMISFIETFHHRKGKLGNTKEKFILEPWQKIFVYILFGWRRKRDNMRRFTEAYLEVARKNGKTILGSVITLCVWMLEGEAGSEAYASATTQEQSNISWDEAAGQVMLHNILKNVITIKNKKMHKTKEFGAIFKALSKNAKYFDGFNPHMILIDEYHAHEDDSRVEVLQSGSVSRECPLTLFITTAGFSISSPCYKYRSSIIKVQKGIFESETQMGMIFCHDEDDEWDDPNVWIKSNPNLGIPGAATQKTIQEKVNIAKQNPDKINETKTKTLNIWTQSKSVWITDDMWMSLKESYTFDFFKDKEVIAAIDMSVVKDLTSICYATIPSNNEPIYLWWWYWIPAINIHERSKQDGVKYDTWLAQDLVYHEDCGYISPDVVLAQVQRDAEHMQITEIVYDPYAMTALAHRLDEEGFVISPLKQSYNSLSQYAVEFENAIYSHRLRHNGNPVSRWMMSCTELKEYNDKKRPVKPPRNSSGSRIDGIVTAMMAAGRVSLEERQERFDCLDVAFASTRI